MHKFWNFIKNEATQTTPESVELRISGEIVSDDDSWIYEWFGIPATSPNNFRNELKQYKGKDIIVWIDSYGGDVFAGAGIYNALKEHDGKVTVKIDGKAMSAASVIAMAGDEILMSPVAIMMIHNPLTSAQGDMRAMRKAADVLDTVKETIINAYAAKTGKTANEISTMMDDESWMSANVAIKNGFADGILYQTNNKTEPENVMNFAFNRLSIQNSVNKSMEHFFTFESKNKLKNVQECQCSECSQTQEDCKCSDCGLCPSCCDNQSCCGCNCQEDGCSNCTMNNNGNKNKNIKEETIVDLNELKNKYPDLYNAAFDEGKQKGITDEKERLKAIDELVGKIDNDFLNKAKYEDNLTAEKTAFQAMKDGKFVNIAYLNNIKNDAKNTNIIPGDVADGADDNENATVLAGVKNIANKAINAMKGGR